MHSCTQVGAVVLGIMLAWQAPAQVAPPVPCQRVVVSVDPEFPPFGWYDGKSLRGASIDIVSAALRQIKLPFEVRYSGPFLRLLEAARNGEVDIIAELKDTPERRAFLAFAPTPIFANQSSVFVQATRSIGYSSWRDLIALKGGVTLGTRFGGDFDTVVATQLKTETAPGIAENFLKLQAGRIVYFLSPYYPAMSHLYGAGQIKNFIALKPPAFEAQNYVGWSLKSPCLGRLSELDASLRMMVQNGEIRRMLDQSFEDWVSNPQMRR